MKLLEDIANILIDNNICTEIDTDVFCDFKPKEPNDIVSLSEYKGSKMDMFTNSSVRSVQLIVRNRRNSVAKEKIWEIYDLLYSQNSIIKLGNAISLLTIRHTPIKLGVDEKNRHEWVINMGVTYNHK